MKRIILIAGAALAMASNAMAEPITRTTTVDRPNYDATQVAVRDPATGTVSRDTTVTRASDGATATRTYDRARTDTGVTASGSATGFAGRTRSFDYERTRTDNGYTASGTATGRNGQTYTATGNRTRTENGFTANQNVVNGAGTTVYNRDAAVSRSGGQINRSVNVTRAPGFHRPNVGGRRR